MREKTKRRRSPKSLNFILWNSFFFFALLTVVIFGTVEMGVLHRVYRERSLRRLDSAATEITVGLNGLQAGEVQLGGYLSAMSEKYGVTARIVSMDGTVLFPRVTDEDGEYEFLKDIPQMKENAGKIYAVDSDVYAYAAKYTIQGQEAFLYVTATYTLDKEVFAFMIFQTTYMAIIMLIVATLLSGAISMYVSGPIADLTEKARKMSSGNLNVDFLQSHGAGYREIEELSESLNYAENELSKADEMQKELLANISHDFKTPLTMIKAYASMIQDFSGESAEKRNKHAQVIIDEADRLASLVNDMLDLSKISSGLEILKPTLFNLSDYLRIVVGRFDYLSETNGYHFVQDIADDLYVEADKDKIGQVLYNLIGNAVNYTGENKTVTVRLYGENGIQHFSVSDTGNGIPPEEINFIWDRYYRSREMHKRPVKGTGLGLSIVKTILTKHNFKFGVRSEIGKGSTFFVDFPAKTVAELKE